MPPQTQDNASVAWWYSRRVQYLATVATLYLLVNLGFRLIFLFGFTDLEINMEVLNSFWIGFKFDLRLAILLTLPVLVLATVPRFNLVTKTPIRNLSNGYVFITLAMLGLVYIIDLGHYQYLGKRIDSTALRFFEDPLISAAMVWQSYPVVWISIGLGLLLLLGLAIVNWSQRMLLRQARPVSRWQKTLGAVSIAAVVIVGTHGRIFEINLHNPVPLRWNDAITSENHAVNALGLNPVLFLYDTFEQRESPYDEALAIEYHADIAHYLDVPNSDGLSLDRMISPADHRLNFDTPPNIIFIMLESLGASRLGAYGNPIQPSPSPNLDDLAENGLFFTNFFVPVSGTARTVWASLTGLPDVLSVKTASRNPFITHQRVVINNFQEHEKFYFIGGAAGWANMSAFIQQSIPDIELYEEQDWQSPIADVWGISDYDLFTEVDGILSQKPTDKPFFAYIQTAGNHRPFTVPDKNGDFTTRVDLDEEELSTAGFRSLAQFNAVRLLDYNIGHFIRLAEESGYLDNSIVVLFGDHNNRVTRTDGFMPAHFDALDLDGLHVPMIIYSPRYLSHTTRHEAASLVDLMPTMAGLLGNTYLNTTMGRDLNATAPEGDRSVYIQTSDKRFPIIGVVNSRFALRMNRDGGNARLHPVNNGDPRQDLSEKFPDEFEKMKRTARGIYELTRYQMYANAP
ncbi:MAG: LTA synthase family protein [Gammaproteobacteria bacterium]|nr:LTA synthase family protein [Gammaproteobacteria bacterium]